MARSLIEESLSLCISCMETALDSLLTFLVHRVSSILIALLLALLQALIQA